MYRNDTKKVFVVGAGASHELGLPVGSDLTKLIAEELYVERTHDSIRYGSNEIIQAVIQKTGMGNDYPAYLEASEHIVMAMPLAGSIDDFLDAHSNNEKIELCAKLAIVNSILKAEEGSPLWFGSEDNDAFFDAQEINKTWYIKFFQLLVQGCKKEDIKQRLSNTCFIIFNYDRCVEFFLHRALTEYYNISSHEAADLLSVVKFIHPYGTVGGLPWQKDSKIHVDFGSVRKDSRNFLKMSEQIKTFSEQVKDKAAMREIINNIYEAGILVFLGFAFHPQNLKLLKSEKILTELKIFATAYKRSGPDREIIKQELIRQYSSALGDPIVYLNDLTCAALFDEYRASLSLRDAD